MPLSKISSAGTTGLGRRNLVINGAMQVAQRGTSGTKSGGNGYGGYLSVDRWGSYYDNTVLATQSETRLDGVLYTPLKVSHSASSDTSLYVYHVIEDGMKKYAGQTLTLSFYAKASSAMTLTGDNSVRAVNVGQSDATSRVGDFTDIDITTSFQRYTRTITLDSSYSSDKPHLFFVFRTDPKTTSDWLQITGVQLEVGSTATEFEHRSYAEELALCQRYFCKSFRPDVAPTQNFGYQNDAVSGGIATYSAGNGYMNSQIKFPVTMRALPDIVFYQTSLGSTSGKWQMFKDGSGWSDLTSTIADNKTQDGFRPAASGTWTKGEAVLYYGGYTAEAEL